MTATIKVVERWPTAIRALYGSGRLRCTHVVVRVVRGRVPEWLRRGRAGVTRELGPALLAIDLDDIAIAEETGEIVIVEGGRGPRRAA